jgi:hypothetical protein
MVFLTLLSSIAVMEWIVRKEPGLRKSNEGTKAVPSAVEAESAASTLDLASLARSLAEECAGNEAPDQVVVKRTSV